MARSASGIIIDTHLHVLQPSRWHYHWLADDSPLYRDFLLNNIVGDLQACGVHTGVLIEATNTPQEIEWLLEMSAASPLQPGVIGWINLQDLDAPEQIARFAAHPLFRGIRLNWLESTFDMTAFARVVSVIGAHGLVVDVLTHPEYLSAVSQFMAAYPDITFVLDHLGGIKMDQDCPALWEQQLHDVAQLPHVFAKLSGWTASHLRSITLVALDLFGSERLMFGSNCPFGLMSYAAQIDCLMNALYPLTATAQANICYQTAARVYRLTISTGEPL